ncbi:phage tail protein [Pseudoalteromonas ostreae]|uniref:phage tail protein n=1 Tax=Pseudoalteromonas ostreae TaxID=2774154 RepID=UPI001B3800AB|nr:tail fiber protein [Pseudoalteromonas ostreae]
MATDAYIGTMVPFGGTFAIERLALCYGQLQAISENTALFSLLGNNFGGDARTTFGLPDLRGRSPVGKGAMPGGMDYNLGFKLGAERIALNLSNLPTHTHAAQFVPNGGDSVTGMLQAATNAANADTPDSSTYLAANSSNQMYYKQGGFAPAPTLTNIAGLIVDGGSSGGTVAIGDTGSSQSFSILNPIEVVNWQIVLNGIYPARS